MVFNFDLVIILWLYELKFIYQYITVKEKSEVVCPSLTKRELKALYRGRWERKPYASTTVINFTFDLDSIQSRLLARAQKEHPNLTLHTLGQSSKVMVKDSLALWRVACGETIKFKYQKKLSADQPGIVFALCKQFSEQGEHWGAKQDGFNKYALICLSYKSANNPYGYAIPHEIGHALGIAHVHGVDSIKQQILVMPQGMGCSVMGYDWLLESPENYCASTKYCPYGVGYALVPGPLDKQICTEYYKFPDFSSTKLLAAVQSGFLISAAEASFSSYFIHAKFQYLNKDMINTLLMISSALIRINYGNTDSRYINTVAVLECVSRIMNDGNADLIRLIKTIANIINIMMSFYELYKSEDAQIRALYLGAILLSSCAGAGVGTLIGKKTNSITDTVVDHFSAAFNWGKQAVSSVFSTLSFFGQKKQVGEVSPGATSNLDMI